MGAGQRARPPDQGPPKQLSSKYENFKWFSWFDGMNFRYCGNLCWFPDTKPPQSPSARAGGGPVHVNWYIRHMTLVVF